MLQRDFCTDNARYTLAKLRACPHIEAVRESLAQQLGPLKTSRKPLVLLKREFLRTVPLFSLVLLLGYVCVVQQFLVVFAVP